jgi:hypothetical protein
MMVSVKKCARCGMNNKELLFLELTNPPKEFSFYAFCPTNGQPIFMWVASETKPKK